MSNMDNKGVFLFVFVSHLYKNQKFTLIIMVDLYVKL